MNEALDVTTGPASLAVAILALLVSLASVSYSRRQAAAALGANAPTVKGELSGGLNQASGACTLRLTFEGNSHIRWAVVSLRSGSGVVLLGEPGAADATRTKVMLDDVTPGTPIRLAAQASDLNKGRLQVVIRGDGFGKVTRNVDVRNCTPFVR